MLHSAGTSFFGPAPDGLVPRDELQRANALLEVTRNVPAIFGPVVAGVLIALFGTGWVFMLDAVSFAVSALRLSLVRLPPKEPRERDWGPLVMLAILTAKWAPRCSGSARHSSCRPR